jgi:hypothetical protein
VFRRYCHTSFCVLGNCVKKVLLRTNGGLRVGCVGPIVNGIGHNQDSLSQGVYPKRYLPNTKIW